MKISTKANLYLLFITAIWGATFPFIRNAVAHVDADLFVVTRYVLASLLVLPLVWGGLKNTPWKLLGHGLIFGSLNSVAYISQTMGLRTIDSSRSAFITGLSVILVPFIAPLFGLGRTRLLDVICSMICLLGLYVLTGADLAQISVGDKWTLLCAVSFAVLIAYLQKLSIDISDHKLLTFYQLLFTIPLSLMFAYHTDIKTLFYPSVIIGILFCALFATTLAVLIQNKYQKFTTAPKAALIFSLEPVFASLFGVLFNGESISHKTLLGGLLILVSLMIPGFLQLKARLRNNRFVET